MDLQENLENLIHWLKTNIAMANHVDGKFLRRMQGRLLNLSRRVFKSQMEWILNEAKRLTVFKTNNLQSKDFLRDNLLRRINQGEGEIDILVNNIPDKDKLANGIVVNAKMSLARGSKTIIKKLGLGQFGISFTYLNPTVLRFLGKKLSHELSNYKGTIHQTTVRAISGILKKSAREGLPYTEVAKLIQEQGKAGVFSIARGEMIAVHEIGSAYEQGKDIMIQDFKNKYPERTVLKEWSTTGDNRVTALCAANEAAGEINYDEPFPNGDFMAPRSDHPRCRCATTYRILGPNE